jgi:hypothetical protein
MVGQIYMEKVTFTTTSCCRSDLLYETYSSFVKNFEGIDFNKSILFLNLDYYDGIGDIDKSITVAKQFFGDVVHNISDEPNFAKAVKWCWRHNFDTSYVFHLEEDWKLLSKIHIENMINILEGEDKSVMNVRLRHRGRLPEGRSSDITLSPSLFKKEFLEICDYMPDIFNPEKVISRSYCLARKKMCSILELAVINSYVFTNLNTNLGEKNNSIVEDIGRLWKNENKIYLHPKGTGWRLG